jgi:hypothetical protein
VTQLTSWFSSCLLATQLMPSPVQFILMMAAQDKSLPPTTTSSFAAMHNIMLVMTSMIIHFIIPRWPKPDETQNKAHIECHRFRPLFNSFPSISHDMNQQPGKQRFQNAPLIKE